jgi:hypothetical protein
MCQVQGPDPYFSDEPMAVFDSWQELQKSRIDLMSGRISQAFERVPHTKGWKGKVRSIVEQRIKDANEPAGTT